MHVSHMLFLLLCKECEKRLHDFYITELYFYSNHTRDLQSTDKL